MPIRSLPSAVLAVLLVAGCAGNTQKKDETKPEKKEEYPITEPLATEAMAGQKVCVLPLSLVLPEDSLAERAPFNDRTKMLAMTDSLIGVALDVARPVGRVAAAGASCARSPNGTPGWWPIPTVWVRQCCAPSTSRICRIRSGPTCGP